MGRLIGSVFRKWRRYIDNQFRDLGFSDATRSPLIALYDSGKELRQRDLAAILGLEASALVRVIGILEQRQLVRCEADPTDKRTKLISLTPLGREWAQYIISKSMEAELRFLATVSDDEKEAMRSALKKMAISIPDG